MNPKPGIMSEKKDFYENIKHNLLELLSKAFLSLTPVWCFPFTEQAEVSERLNDRRERT